MVKGYRKSLIVDQVEIPGYRLGVARKANFDFASGGEHLSLAKNIGIPILIIGGSDIDAFKAPRRFVDECKIEIRCDRAGDTKQEKKNEKTFHELGLVFLLLLFVRARVLVNGVPVLVLHGCGLKHLVSFRLLAGRFVIARLAIEFRLIVIGIEGHWIRPIANVHHRIRCQKFIELTARDKKRSGDKQEDKAEGHECGLTQPSVWSIRKETPATLSRLLTDDMLCRR